MIKALSDFQNKAKKFQAEIILACSTTFIIAGIYCEKLLPLYIYTNPELVYKYLPLTGLFQFFGIAKGVASVFLPLLQGISSDITVEILVRFLAVPVPQLVFFLILPILTLLFTKSQLSEYGFTIGDWKKGLLYSGVSLAVMTPFLYFASGMPSFIKFYTSVNTGGFWMVATQYGLYLFCWEFLYRGYLYFSLEQRTGSLAIWISSVPFAITHLGKPATEALTCYFGGLVLGYISMKTRSFSYAFIIHWGLYTILTFFIFYRLGYFTR